MKIVDEVNRIISSLKEELFAYKITLKVANKLSKVGLCKKYLAVYLDQTLTRTYNRTSRAKRKWS